MLRIVDNDDVFNFRVAGLLFHEGKLLIHRGIHDDFYAFPGGRAEMGEDTRNTVRREFQEEIRAEIHIIRLLWVMESFFSHLGSRYHELCFYYLVGLDNPDRLQTDGSFRAQELDGTWFEYRWIAPEAADGINLVPGYIKTRIHDLPYDVRHVIVRE